MPLIGAVQHSWGRSKLGFYLVKLVPDAMPVLPVIGTLLLFALA